MFNLVGKKLDDAKKWLVENKISNFKVIKNNSTREFLFDNELVVQVRVENEAVILVTSNFLLNI